MHLQSARRRAAPASAESSDRAVRATPAWPDGHSCPPPDRPVAVLTRRHCQSLPLSVYPIASTRCANLHSCLHTIEFRHLHVHENEVVDLVCNASSTASRPLQAKVKSSSHSDRISRTSERFDSRCLQQSASVLAMMTCRAIRPPPIADGAARRVSDYDLWQTTLQAYRRPEARSLTRCWNRPRLHRPSGAPDAG